MARTWTIAEAVEAFAKKEKNNILDIGDRYPLLADLISRTLAGDGDAFVEFAAACPERLTANVMHGALKDGVGEPDGAEPKPEKAKAAPKAAPATGEKRGRGRPPAAPKPEPVDDENENEYEGMTPQELYKACKGRSINAEMRKPADYYVKLLQKDDAKKAAAEKKKTVEADADDWGEEEVPKKGKAKPAPVEDDEWEI